jgi:hypothetical protein
MRVGRWASVSSHIPSTTIVVVVVVLTPMEAASRGFPAPKMNGGGGDTHSSAIGIPSRGVELPSTSLAFSSKQGKADHKCCCCGGGVASVMVVSDSRQHLVAIIDVKDLLLDIYNM